MAEPHVLVDAGISSREAEVLAALGEHLTNAEIANRLFISVRTVESHVSSLLRKLGVTDRRALAGVAASVARPQDRPQDRAQDRPAVAGTPVLSSPLTSFVGRVRERAALAAALESSRQVTAVGPGGVGKTRLALAVMAEVSGRFADGGWFVDLVPVSDPAMVAAAVAAALGVGERQGRSVEEAVVAALADREALLVLDNCEHARDGVAPFVERLLAGCPRLVVLATSRARLLVPYERVFAVPGMSLDSGESGESGDGGEVGGGGDAVTLFLERAAAVGAPPVTTEDRRRIAEVCRALDGVALAIELAAARLPALGIDGLEAGLADQLRLLAGGHRADDRHRSVTAALDWSHQLLDGTDQAVLRRVAVFMAPFAADAAAEVAGFPPLDAAAVADSLAHLTEQSLMTAMPAVGGTRYRALETIRQYGMRQLAQAGDLVETRSRHLRWCLRTAAALDRDRETDPAGWRAAFDRVGDDLRAALQWADQQPGHRDGARELALALARLAFARGLPSESQQRYEQAAALATGPADAPSALRYAAGAAWCRMSGDDMLRLYQEAAAAARAAGDSGAAARDLAVAVLLIGRLRGMISHVPSAAEAGELLATARQLAGDAAAARAAVLLAETSDLEDADEELAVSARRAVGLAHEAGDRVGEITALDVLTGAQLGQGDVLGAAATARRRTELLAALPVDAAVGGEALDVLVMAAETSTGAGDLKAARHWAERLRDLPFLAEEGHIATSRLLVVDALAGDWADMLAASARYREGLERAGRPQARSLAMAAAAVAMVHGLRGDEATRAEWLGIVAALGVTAEELAGCETGYAPTFDAIVLLHRGQPAEAVSRLAVEPESFRRWNTGLWRQWYAAVWAEAAVLAGHPDARSRLARAGTVTAGNPVAAALTDRARALLTGDRAGLVAAAGRLEAAGCHYQCARTRVLAGGSERAAGAAALAAMGATPLGVSDVGPGGE